MQFNSIYIVKFIFYTFSFKAFGAKKNQLHQGLQLINTYKKQCLSLQKTVHTTTKNCFIPYIWYLDVGYLGYNKKHRGNLLCRKYLFSKKKKRWSLYALYTPKYTTEGGPYGWSEGSKSSAIQWFSHKHGKNGQGSAQNLWAGGLLQWYG